ncbi:hypothetical protein MOUN0_M04852 [Monosporozyma unispora]
MVFSLRKNSKMEVPEAKLSIELDGVGEDGVLFLRGERERAASIFISGKLRVITTKPVEARSLNIRLLGKSRLNVPISDEEMKEDYETQFIRSETYFFQHCWNNIITPDILKRSQLLKSDSADKSRSQSKDQSQSCFKSLFSIMKRYDGLPEQNTTRLEPGEHIFYFKTVLPGDLPESVHNHPNVYVAYQLTATIQQYRGLPDLNITKQLMIIRTVSIDMLDFQNSEYVQAKLKHIFAVYVELPWKIAAIGSMVDVCCLVRSKNIDFKITETNFELFEYGVYQLNQMTVSKRRKVGGMVIANPVFSTKKFTTDAKERTEWYKRFNFKIPDSLGQLTQDCSVLKRIKVSHLLEVRVTASMPGGKVYHLDLQLPIYLYISTFIPLKIKKRNYFKEPTLLYCPPPTEKGGPVECNSTILEGNNLQANKVNISNQDILMNDLFPSSYEDHINDPKIEVFGQNQVSKDDFVNYSNIMKCNAINSAQFENSFDIRYPPPCYENSTESLCESDISTLLEPSIDSVNMGEVYFDKFQNERLLSSVMNID